MTSKKITNILTCAVAAGALITLSGIATIPLIVMASTDVQANNGNGGQGNGGQGNGGQGNGGQGNGGQSEGAASDTGDANANSIAIENSNALTGETSVTPDPDDVAVVTPDPDDTSVTPDPVDVTDPVDVANPVDVTPDVGNSNPANAGAGSTTTVAANPATPSSPNNSSPNTVQGDTLASFSTTEGGSATLGGVAPAAGLIGLGNLPGDFQTATIGPLCGYFDRNGLLVFGRWADEASAPALISVTACN